MVACAVKFWLLVSCWASWAFTHNRALQVAGSSARMDDVAFGIMTCGKYLKTRLLAQKRTWLQQVHNVLAFSDVAADEDLGVEVVVDGDKPQKTEMLYNDGAWRTIAMVETLHVRFPLAKWYVFVDDDTYIYTENLLRVVLAHRNPVDSHYLGFPVRLGTSLHGIIPNKRQPLVAIGGAGVGVSRGMMQRLASQLERCKKDYTWDWPGDARLSQCVEDIGGDVEPEWHLYPENVATELAFFNGGLRLVPPASFHHVSPQEMVHLHAAHVVHDFARHRQADFAALTMLKSEYYAKDLNLTYQVRLGLFVDVFHGEATDPAPRDLERVLFADQLQAFSIANASNTTAFEQHFVGSRCSSSLQQNFTAAVHLQCVGCDGSPAPAEPETCSARRRGLCHAELTVAVTCPVWKPVSSYKEWFVGEDNSADVTC